MYLSFAINFSEEPFSTSVETVRMGEDVLPSLASSGTLYSFKTRSYWTLLKSAGYEICFSEMLFKLKRLVATSKVWAKGLKPEVAL